MEAAHPHGQSRSEPLQILARKEKQAHNFYQIATGARAEMECSKSTVSLLKKIYQPGMTVADVGCGAGHYLRSFQRNLDSGINYFGIDAGQPHIKMARRAFGDTPFLCGDIRKLPIGDNSFDIVFCNNVITALPPPPGDAFKELIRISRQWIVVRLIVGTANYIVKVFPENLPPGMNATDYIRDQAYSTYRNIYSEAYIAEMIEAADPVAAFNITADRQFGDFNQDNPDPNATRVVNGMQIAGNLVIDQRYVVIQKAGHAGAEWLTAGGNQ